MGISLNFFATNFGWWGMAGNGQRVTRLWIGHRTRTQVRCCARQDFPDQREADWQPDLRAALQEYTRGAPISFDDIELDLEDYSDFQQRVMQGARSVRYGQRQTYGGLAAQAGTPGAARAVGNVMAGNRFPIIVPCHRIVLSNGGLGGFSAPRGVSLKQKLLNMESRQTGVDSRPRPMT